MPERRFVAVVLASLAVACAGLLIAPSPLDFDVYTTAGRAVRSGVSLYGPDVRVGRYGFTYPPFAGLVLVPFAMLPHAVALALMTAGSVGALGVMIRLSAPELLRRAVQPRAAGALLAVAAMITCEPVRATLWDGQINLVLAAVVLVDLLAPARALCGVGVGVATAVKLTPGVFVAYLLVCRRYRAAANAGFAFAAVTVAAWVILPGDSRTFWFHELYAGSGIGDRTRCSNILGLLLRSMAPGLGYPLWAAVCIPVTVTGLALARRQHAVGREAYALGIVGVTGCLISPVTWTHHWVWCIPWLANYSIDAWRRAGAARVIACLVASWFVVIGIIPGRVMSGAPLLAFVSANALLLGVVVAILGALATGTAPRGAELTRLGTPGVSSRS